MASKVSPADGTMMAAHVTEWCAIGTVPESISFGEIAVPSKPKKSEVLIC